MAAPDPLAGLRDLHWPEALGADPLADMAVAAALGLLAGALAASLIRAAARRRASLRREAAALLDEARALPEPERLAAQAALLRRLARTLDPGMPAGERGPAYLARLDRLFRTTFFQTGEGRAFGDALYAPPAGSARERDKGLSDLLRMLRR
jgi:hypothetical protein